MSGCRSFCEVCKRDDVLVHIPGRAERVGIDACVADLVRALNAGSREPVTVGACCGHGRVDGEILLADGRVLVIRNRDVLQSRSERWTASATAICRRGTRR